MLVTVTGGTGFVGAHSIAAMVSAGHRVRMLVRDPSKVERALAPLHVEPSAVDVVAGDVTDERSVAGAVRGADAVLHAASVYSFDSRLRARMRRVNERGTEVVLGAARRAAGGPIIHVSTVVALAPEPSRDPSSPARPGTIDERSPVARPRETYAATKAAAELVARRHQAEGAPVVITYPPALIGPHDPNLGDQTARLRDALRGLMPLWPAGGFPLGDVRDTAALHARLLTAPDATPAVRDTATIAPAAPIALTARTGSAPHAACDAAPAGPGGPETGRHFGPGRYVTTREYVRVLREVTGRALPAAFLPAATMIPVGLLADLVQRVWPWHIPAEYGAIHTCAHAGRPAGTAGAGGITPRPLAETVGDTVRWLCESGHLPAGRAGLAYPAPALVR
ncbi:NAD-dependent epimerase/dehydratase family protein [Streptosporangium sandarakinum]|uniref:NAD-dependent epimerase/dehydratase family protein n=1 Tax=Streptosporangium sandarakinum TaxID=1260955 RepID=UPI00368AC513